MEPNEVTELIEFVMDTFNKPQPNKRKLDYFYDELCQLKSEALESIKQHFRDLDACPSNVVKEVKAAYGIWTSSNAITHKQTDCFHCNGEGLLRRLCWDGYIVSEAVGRCPHCENWRPFAGTAIPEVRDLNARPYRCRFSDKEIEAFKQKQGGCHARD